MVGMPYNVTKANLIYLIYMYKEALALNNLQWLICHKTKTKPNPIYLIYMYKEDLALNNLQRLICHKTKPNQILILLYTLSKLNSVPVVYINQFEKSWSTPMASVKYVIFWVIPPQCMEDLSYTTL